jgi:predicted dehydrogenase
MGGKKRVKAALIGSGAISGTYLKNITTKFHVLDMVGCSDIIPDRSAKRAAEFGLKQMTNEEILNDPEIEIVINTTYPTSHYAVSKECLYAGKHVYVEKMMAVTLDEGKELMELARSKKLLFTTAPDTFLGGGWQTARHLIDGGAIGDIVSILGVCIRSYQDNGDVLSEPKSFIFCAGGGIPFDMGGYYLHNMINLAGRLNRVGGFIQTRRETRPYTNPRHPGFGGGFKIDTPNNLAASLEFTGGALGSLIITSEANAFTVPTFEVHGTIGSLLLFDPNDFGPSDSGHIQIIINTGGSTAPKDVPILFPFHEENRGIGAADMAYALLNGRKPRADAQIGFHAFEAIHGIWKSGTEGGIYSMTSECERPAALRMKPLGGTAWETILND